MKLLVDTHVFLWAITDNPKLSKKHKALWLDGENELWLSVGSVLEMLIKAGVGWLPLPASAAAYIAKQMEKNRVSSMPIRTAHFAGLEGLPPLHRDPFDRLLVAQARAEKMPVMSVDARLKQYGVKVLPARLSLSRQERGRIGWQLLVGGVEQEADRHVVTHHGGEFDDALPSERVDSFSEEIRADFVFAEQLAGEADEDGFLPGDAGDVFIELDGVDDGLLDSGAASGGFVGGPDELLVSLARHDHNGDFRKTGVDDALVADRRVEAIP